MNLWRPNMRQQIAVNLLKWRYNSEYNPSDLATMTQYIADNFSSTNKSKDLYLRMQGMYINMTLIDSFLLEITDEEKKLLYFIYKEKQNYTYIADKLHFSSSTVIRMHEKLLNKISNLHFFEIEKEDYYCRLRIINTLRLLDLRIISLNEAKFHLNINQKFLNKLQVLRSKYRKILNLLNSELNRKGTGESIIAAKVRNPATIGVKELADQCNTSPGNVSRYLSKYMAVLCGA